MEPPPGSAVMAKPPLITKNTRTSNLSMGVSRAGIFQINDLVSFTVYAPTQAVNNALTFAKSVFASPLDGYLAGWIQGLSLIARRQINTEFAYSVKMDRYSKLDSAITYRLNPGNSDVAASLRYSIEF